MNIELTYILIEDNTNDHILEFNGVKHKPIDGYFYFYDDKLIEVNAHTIECMECLCLRSILKSQ